MNKNKTLYIVLGPTASGKTSLAIKLAQKLDTEIVSADSRQVFKQMNIGVARPTEEELNKVKHHMIACWDIQDNYNVAIYEKQALQIIESLFVNHDNVVLCGGSGLYIKAIINGIDNMPDVNPKIRQELKIEFEEKGLDYIKEELKQKDINYYNTVDTQNQRRIIRALEIIRQTGKPFSSFLSGEKIKRDFNIKILGLKRDREDLIERIDIRVENMIKEGLIEEVRTLIPYKNLPSLYTVGYREIFNYFDGKTNLNEAVELIKIHTRQYAKRQKTWFNKTPNVNWYNISNQKIKIDTIL